MLYQCKDCSFATNHKSTFINHERIHTGEKPFKCTFCNKSFSRKSTLKVHTRIHTGEKPFKCTICKYSTTTSSSLKLHMRTHTGEKPYHCNVCTFKCSSHSTLKAHIRTHTGEKPLKCNFCDFKCSSHSTLKAHVRSHTGERPYECKVCHQRFKTNGQLLNHMSIHTKNKSHVCKTCKKTFTRKSQLQLHQLIHDGLKPYKCSICSYSSRTSSHVTRHMASIHGKTVDNGYTIDCKYIDMGTEVFNGSKGVKCGDRFKSGREYESHVKKCHTKEGIEKKRFKSELQMKNMFDKHEIKYDHDRTNRISFTCGNASVSDKNSCAYIDFRLVELQKTNFIVFVGNDEKQHRQYPCDLQRVANIYSSLCVGYASKELTFVYIRFNPHRYQVNGIVFDPTLDIRFRKLRKVLDDIKDSESDISKKIKIGHVNLLYMFYDIIDNRLAIYNNSEINDYKSLYEPHSLIL